MHVQEVNISEITGGQDKLTFCLIDLLRVFFEAVIVIFLHRVNITW